MVIVAPADEADMLALLKKIALGQIDATQVQVRAAIAAVQYTHPKKGESTGKKEQGEAAAKAAASGKYGVRQGPRLAVNNK
ncbi:MAG: hypothetical protein EOO31_06850 [Comamonadaceae bacterium]|nr:MAG: hypothetical protein EOO31_06850 [Comamonadaceae bacterium]